MEGKTAKGKMAYCDVYVSKGTEKLKLIFDKDEEFVKKAVLPADAPVTTPDKVTAPADTTKK